MDTGLSDVDRMLVRSQKMSFWRSKSFEKQIPWYVYLKNNDEYFFYRVIFFNTFATFKKRFMKLKNDQNFNMWILAAFYDCFSTSRCAWGLFSDSISEMWCTARDSYTSLSSFSTKNVNVKTWHKSILFARQITVKKKLYF